MERSPELLDAYLQAVQELSQGQSRSDYRSRFPDISAFGTDPDELWIGQDTLRQVDEETDKQRVALAAAGGKYTAGDPIAWAEDDFGWLIARPVLHMPDGAEVHMRFTMVCHRENGRWKWVHQHTSIGVPNEDVPAFSDDA